MVSARLRIAERLIWIAVVPAVATWSSGCRLMRTTQTTSDLFGSASQLSFSTQPSSTAASGVAFTQQPMISVQDQDSVLVKTASKSVGLAAYSDSKCTTAASGSLSNSTASSANGVASFTQVAYSGSGTIYIGASSNGLASACSGAVVVSAGSSSSSSSNSSSALGPAPSISVILPVGAIGPSSGGTLLTIYGANFSASSLSKVGGSNCSTTSFVNSSQIICTAPALTFGLYGVAVVNADGQTASLASAYTSDLGASSTMSLFASAVRVGSGPGNTIGVAHTVQTNMPWGIAVHGGNLYFTEYNNHVVKKLNFVTNTVTWVAGPTDSTSGNVTGAASAARFSSPTGLAVDPAGSGTLYIGEYMCMIKRLDLGSMSVTAVAGTGSCSTSSNGIGSGAGAVMIDYVRQLAFHGTNLFFTASWSSGSFVRRMDLAGNFHYNLAGLSGAGACTDGTGSGAMFNQPYGVVRDGANNRLIIADTYNHVIRTLDLTNNAVATVAGSCATPGTADGVGALARFNNPTSLALDTTTGYLYVADRLSHRIRKINPATWSVTTIAGTGTIGSVDDYGTAASFNQPVDLALDGQSLYVSDSLNHLIRKVDISNTNYAVSSVVGAGNPYGHINGSLLNARFNVPAAMAWDGANALYVADTNNHVIRKIDLVNQTVTTIAGNPGNLGSADGTGGAAQFYYPNGVVHSNGFLYVVDTSNNKIRKINLANNSVTTLAGNGAYGYVDGSGATASFRNPRGIALVGASLYVADYFNNNIRKVEISDGTVTTFAGSTIQTMGSNDGTGTVARFNYPLGIVSDGTYLYVSDRGNHNLRKIRVSDAVVTTLAGMAGISGSTDGTGTSARFFAPAAMAVDPSGNYLYVVDSYNNMVRKVKTADSNVTTLFGVSATTNEISGALGSARPGFSSGSTNHYGIVFTSNALYFANEVGIRIIQ